jgi:hypothetical protein
MGRGGWGETKKAIDTTRAVPEQLIGLNAVRKDLGDILSYECRGLEESVKDKLGIVLATLEYELEQLVEYVEEQENE